MRIAISGSHATGKSSLVAELAHRLSGSVVMDEPYYLLEAEGHVFSAPPTAEDFEALLECSIALLAAKHHTPVLFDRSPADYLAYLAARDEAGTAQSSRDLTGRVATALQTLDLVVFVPVEDPDRVANAELPRLRRHADTMLRAMFIDGEWGFDAPVLEVRGSVAERASQVMAHIARMRVSRDAVIPASHFSPQVSHADHATTRRLG